MRAALEAVEGAWGEPVRFSVPSAAPDAPTELALAAPPTACSLALRWTLPHNNGARVTDYTLRLTQVRLRPASPRPEWTRVGLASVHFVRCSQGEQTAVRSSGESSDGGGAVVLEGAEAGGEDGGRAFRELVFSCGSRDNLREYSLRKLTPDTPYTVRYAQYRDVAIFNSSVSGFS